ncbi:MAG TPA: AAA family ATPase [Candidatus Paceibacterota bacterium]|nr:AAA family ATPase [Candidatus Paceibacterota bacterium]
MEKEQTTVILFRGRPGVGKSAVSDAFAKERKLPILRKDDIYDSTSVYVEDHIIRNKISYDSLFRILESNTSSGTSLVLDYPFQNDEEVINFQKWCEERNVHLVSVLVICSDREVWKRRFNVRSENPVPNQLITDLDELERHYGNLNLKSLEGEIVVDTVESVETILKQLATYVPQEG